MKIDKAIEILSDLANRGVATFNQDFKDATKLGIEALKEVREARLMDCRLGHTILRGETEE